MGYGITIHMGEVPKYQMMDFNLFKPDRVSHTYYFKDEEYNEVIKHRIPIEVCPTGSYNVKSLISYKDIPFKNYHRKIVENMERPEYSENTENIENKEYDLYCINTDDTMLFTTDLSQEYFEVASNFEMECEEVRDMVLRTVEFIFEKDETVRDELRKRISSY